MLSLIGKLCTSAGLTQTYDRARTPEPVLVARPGGPTGALPSGSARHGPPTGLVVGEAPHLERAVNTGSSAVGLSATTWPRPWPATAGSCRPRSPWRRTGQCATGMPPSATSARRASLPTWAPGRCAGAGAHQAGLGLTSHAVVLAFGVEASPLAGELLPVPALGRAGRRRRRTHRREAAAPEPPKHA